MAPPRVAEEEFRGAGRGRVVAHRVTLNGVTRASSSSIEKDRQASILSAGAPISAAQFHSWNGAATPRPAM